MELLVSLPRATPKSRGSEVPSSEDPSSRYEVNSTFVIATATESRRHGVQCRALGVGCLGARAGECFEAQRHSGMDGKDAGGGRSRQRRVGLSGGAACRCGFSWC
jgi:hypothetical protein